MKLSNNFTLKELIKSSTAMRKGIDNTPSAEHIRNLKNLAVNVLQPVRDQFGSYRTTSGYRSPELCDAIGSSKTSNHAFGFAHDGEAIDPNVTNLEVLIWIAENLEFKELIAEYFDMDDPKAGWIHVAYQDGYNPKIIKVKDKNNHYTKYTLDELKKYYNV